MVFKGQLQLSEKMFSHETTARATSHPCVGPLLKARKKLAFVLLLLRFWKILEGKSKCLEGGLKSFFPGPFMIECCYLYSIFDV